MPVDFDLPFPVLPFPGSVSVSCTYSTSSPGACQPGEGPGVSVGTEGTLEIERSDTTLDAEGCPTQTLSVTASLELQTTVSGETPVASGSLTTFLGEASTYSVTVPPDAADAIEHGDRAVPNPIDPRTIRAGESVELSQEFYAGHDLEASYRALQLELGYEEGTRVSAGVSRVNPEHRARLRRRRGLRAQRAQRRGRQRRRRRRARGRRRAQRRQAAQRRHRHLHRRGLEGLPVVPEVRQAAARGRAGHERPDAVRRVRVHRRHAGSRRTSATSASAACSPSRARPASRPPTPTAASTAPSSRTSTTPASPSPRTPSPAASPSRPATRCCSRTSPTDTIDTYEHVTGQPLAHGADNQVRLDFTPDDFAAIQEQAFDQLQWQLEQNRIDLSEDELRDIMEEYPHGGDPYGIDSSLRQRLRAGRRRDARAGALRALPRLGRRPRRRRRPAVADRLHDGHHGRPPRHPRLAVTSTRTACCRARPSRRAAPSAQPCLSRKRFWARSIDSSASSRWYQPSTLTTFHSGVL